MKTFEETQSLSAYIERRNSDNIELISTPTQASPPGKSIYEQIEPKLIIDIPGSTVEIYPQEEFKPHIPSFSEFWNYFLLAPFQNLDPSFDALSKELHRAENTFNETISGEKTTSLAIKAREHYLAAHQVRPNSILEAHEYAQLALLNQINYLISSYQQITASKVVDSIDLIESTSLWRIPRALNDLLSEAQHLHQRARAHQERGEPDLARHYFIQAIRKTERISLAVFERRERIFIIRWLSLAAATGGAAALNLLF